jgi:hypothetical protein
MIRRAPTTTLPAIDERECTHRDQPPRSNVTMSAPPRPLGSRLGTIAPRFHYECGGVSGDGISTRNRPPTTAPERWT